MFYFFFSIRRRHTRYWRDWSSDVCSSDLILGVRYRTVLDHEQPGHPLDVVLGDQLSRRVQEHRVGNVVVPRSAVDVDDSEGGLIVLVLPGKILETGDGLVRVFIQGTPEGEYVDTVVRELEDAVVHALHPE